MTHRLQAKNHRHGCLPVLPSQPRHGAPDRDQGQGAPIHLCTKCAQDKGVNIKADFSLGEIFGGLIEPSGPASKSGQEKERRDSRLVCPRCGLSYLEFRKSGRLGCPDDYEYFKKGVLPFLEKIHLATQHVGKIPSRADTRAQQVKELIGLRRQLSSLFAKEAYEEAAKVRDKIKTIEEGARGV